MAHFQGCWAWRLCASVCPFQGPFLACCRQATHWGPWGSQCLAQDGPTGRSQAQAGCPHNLITRTLWGGFQDSLRDACGVGTFCCSHWGLSTLSSHVSRHRTPVPQKLGWGHLQRTGYAVLGKVEGQGFPQKKIREQGVAQVCSPLHSLKER